MIEISTDQSMSSAFYSAKIKKFGNFKEQLRKWQRYMQEEQRKRFRMLAKGGTYDEVTWKYFSDSSLRHGYRRVKGKIKDGDPIMRDSNTLYDSFRGSEFKLTNNTASFRITVPYAAAHQFGVPQRNLPARPILHVSQKNIKYLERLVKDYLSDGKYGRRPNG
jgi:phage gpG-like protein